MEADGSARHLNRSQAIEQCLFLEVSAIGISGWGRDEPVDIESADDATEFWTEMTEAIIESVMSDSEHFLRCTKHERPGLNRGDRAN